MKYLLMLLLISLLVFHACGSRGNLTLDISEIRTDLTDVLVKYDIPDAGSRRPAVLVTIGRAPQSPNDGILLEGPEVIFSLPEPGRYDVYLTLVENKRFVSTPAMKAIRVFADRPEMPDLELELVAGTLYVSLSVSDDDIRIYRLIINEKEFSSKSGNFKVEVSRGSDLRLEAFCIREDGSPSDSVRKTLDLSADNPPSVSFDVPSPYTGGVIDVYLEDDWDAVEELHLEVATFNYRFYFNEGMLYPDVELPEGRHTVLATATDSGGNHTSKAVELLVTKTPSDKIPELLIEEGTFRRAVWNYEAGSLHIQRFTNGFWTDYITPPESTGSAVIPREGMSEKGDFFRLAASSNESLHLPSIPVFAKESQFRRFTAENIVSFMGTDALLSTGNHFRLVGNLTVWQGTVVRIEPGVELVFPRGNNLIVSGVLDMDGRQNRISVESSTVTGAITVVSGGSIIARGVDFSRTRLVIKGADVVVLEDCVLADGLRVEGARSVQIYSSKITGGFHLDTVGETYIDNSAIDAETVSFLNSPSVSVSRTRIESAELSVGQSKISFTDSEITATNVAMEHFSATLVLRGNLYASSFRIHSGTSVQLEYPQFLRDEATVNLSHFSRLTYSKNLSEQLKISADKTSSAVEFH